MQGALHLYPVGLISSMAYIQGGLYLVGLISRGAHIQTGLIISSGAYIQRGLIISSTSCLYPEGLNYIQWGLNPEGIICKEAYI